MLTNLLKRKCTIQKKTVTSGPLGDTETWADVGSYWCRRISVDVQTRAAYQQLNTVVTDRFLFSGKVELNLGEHRIIYAGTTYELIETAQHLDNETTVMVKQS